MKVQIKKQEFCRILDKTDFIESYSSSKMPDFIELDAEPIEEKCVHKRINYSQSHVPYCLDCYMYLPASSSFPIIEELDGLQKYNVLDLALKFNEIIRALNTMRK